MADTVQVRGIDQLFIFDGFGHPPLFTEYVKVSPETSKIIS